jgi:3-deoxy-D-manno-octulosonate 8-phosphate phosphatase (KDO 8-P phosphatase)
MDVDGVLTDGSISYDDSGGELRAFGVRDGFGIRLWQRLGFSWAIITGRGGGAVEHLLAARGLLDGARARYDPTP